jgi:hypothetical protein
MISYILSFIPGTGPYYKKFLRLEELKRLPNEWDSGPITHHKVKMACELMNDFRNGLTTGGTVSIRKHINEGTTKRLMGISQECLEFILVKQLKLDHMKKLLREWEGENIDIVRVRLYEYLDTMRKLTDLGDDLVFYDSLEEFVENYLGEDLYERLDTMIRFFKQLDNFKKIM